MNEQEIMSVFNYWVDKTNACNWNELCELYASQNPRTKVLWDNMLHNNTKENMVRLIYADLIDREIPSQEMRIKAGLIK